MSAALVDNDVLHKTAMYGLMHDLFQSMPFGANDFHILGAAKFIIQKKIAKRPPARGCKQALGDFKSAIAQMNELEPTVEETSLAAELEYIAGQSGNDLDNGESLLCAIFLLRSPQYIFTGDKRAILAVAGLSGCDIARGLMGKFVCLEQLIRALMRQMDSQKLRNAICTDAGADKALENCFACRSSNSSARNVIDGLDSYINDLHTRAPNVLFREITT